VTRCALALAALLVPGCTRDKPKPDPTTDGGTPADGGTTTETWGPGRPVSYTCPDPPDDAVRVRMGTAIAHQVFYEYNENTWPVRVLTPRFPLYALKVRGLSYTDPDSCAALDVENLYMLDVRNGVKLNEYDIELLVTLPGTGVEDWLGEHGDGGGHLVRPDRGAHQLSFGYHDGTTYHWIDSLPYGWTRSTVCMGEITPEFTYLTVLFDPADGPYMTNHRNPWTRPLWLEIILTATGSEEKVDPMDCASTASCRSCFGTVYSATTREDWFPSEKTE